MMGSTAPPPGQPIRVGLADDHRIMRDGLCALLARESDMEVVGTAGDGLDAVRLAREQQPDVMITDINMPGLNGIEAIRRICSEEPQVRMLCLSVHDDSRTVLEVLHAGAAGYVLKDSSCDELALAIRKVMGRQVYLSPELVTVVVGELRQQADRPGSRSAPQLTPRERELVQLLSEGFGTQDIAERLHVSGKTVATHREHVMHKLQLGSVAELTRFALREGLSSLDTPCTGGRRTRRPRAD
jgi:DNA-binding NarL/FixJ family response regulator